MNKNFKLYAVIWAVLFAFYNVVIFLMSRYSMKIAPMPRLIGHWYFAATASNM